MPPPAAPAPTGVLDTLIPAQNGDALTSYYVGLFSILPLFGLAMGPFAIAKGRNALRLVREQPGVAGKTHARVGIGCGALSLLFNVLLTLLILAAILSKP
jgi:hypothetical protein